MSTFLLIALVSLLIALVAGGILWSEQGGVDMTAPENITQVCMDCQAHIGGPNPPLHRLCISHGLCPSCARRWLDCHDPEKFLERHCPPEFLEALEKKGK